MSRPRIVIGQRVFEETLQALRPHAEVISPVDADAMNPDLLRRALESADAWMAFMPDSADAALLERCPRLKLIAGALKGGDNFDVEACSRAAIWFSLVPDLLTVPTAELGFALMIGLGRQLLAGDRWVRSGQFRGWEPRFYGLGLAGARVGFVGMGAIGRAMAERLKPFGVLQRYCDPFPLASDREAELGLSRAPLDELLGWADYVVLAAPLTPATTHIIDAEALARLRPGALLVNPSRGSLVDETAVLEALEAGRLGGYAADAFEMEDWARADRPREIAPGLLERADTLFTPHLGSAVIDVRKAIERRAADNILDLVSGRTPRDAVNPGARTPEPA
jgi:phosphonate dehydrogenase